MKKRIMVLILVLSMVMSSSSYVSAEDTLDCKLAQGGKVILTQDYTLVDDVMITKDTVLDLNGHTLSGSIWEGPYINGDGIEIIINYQPELYIAEGATVTIKNGTLNKVGIIVDGILEEASRLTIQGGISGICVEPNGFVRELESCNIDTIAHGIENGGQIEKIYNCEITTQKWSAVHNNEYKNARIKWIEHCRFIGYDDRGGSALCANPGNSIGTVKDSVLVGYGLGGIDTTGSIDSVIGCTIISFHKPQITDDFGSAVSSYGRSDDSEWSTGTIKFMNCVMIAEKYACADIVPYVLEDFSDVAEGFAYMWRVQETFPSMENCTFFPLKDVKDTESFMAWEMKKSVEPEKPSMVGGAVAVTISGQAVRFSEDMGIPFIDENNRTQVPARVVLESYGCKVSWDTARRVAVAEKENRKVEIPIGMKSIVVDGKAVATDTVALIKNGRTYLPIRPVLEAFDATVSWDGANRIVIVE